MITITGPAFVIALTVGYLGINTIVNGVKGLFEKKEHRKDRK